MKIEQLGQKLRSLRKAANLTIKEVAAEVGVVESQIGHIEGGRRLPPLPTLQRFASAVDHRLELRLIQENEDLTEVNIPSHLIEYVEILEGLEGLDYRLVIRLLEDVVELSDDAKGMMLGMIEHTASLRRNTG